MTADLAGFLRVWLDEDEQAARHAYGDHNEDGPEWTEVSSGALSTGSELHGIGDSAITRHMERWDPKRVLAEVDAKRRIIKAHPWRLEPDWPSGRQCRQCATEWPCNTLRLLALPCAAHASYKPQWAPDA
jgi:hypothetical protein